MSQDKAGKQINSIRRTERIREMEEDLRQAIEERDSLRVKVIELYEFLNQRGLRIEHGAMIDNTPLRPLVRDVEKHELVVAAKELAIRVGFMAPDEVDGHMLYEAWKTLIELLDRIEGSSAWRFGGHNVEGK